MNKHYDPFEDLEKQVISELQESTKKLGGTMNKMLRCNSTGRQSKIVEIEYDVREI